jgi:hypothetical protein
MAVNLSPVGGVAAQFFDNSGYPLTGGKLYSYAAGTTTPAATYTSSNGLTAHSNPIVLDAAGRVPAGGEIWLTDGVIYKFVLKTSTDTLIATYDNITGINSNSVAYTNQQEIITATAGQTVFPLSISYAPGTNSLSVFVDGVNQYGPGASYSYVETDSTTVTFNSGLHVGAEVKFTTTQQQGAGAVDASQVSYDPPFTGSVVTNVEVKLAQYLSTNDFADIDPTGVDDSTLGLQAAIDAAIAAQQDLMINAGTYKITDTLVIDSTSIRIFGEGKDNTTIDSFATGSAILCSFWGGRLDGFGVYINNATGNGIEAGNSSRNCSISDVYLQVRGAYIASSTGSGIYLNTTNDTISGAFSGGLEIRTSYALGFKYGVRFRGPLPLGENTWTSVCMYDLWLVGKASGPVVGSAGIYMNAGSNGIGTCMYGGTIEGYSNGIFVEDGSNGGVFETDMEGNTIDWIVGNTFSGRVVPAQGTPFRRQSTQPGLAWYKEECLTGAAPVTETYYSTSYVLTHNEGSQQNFAWRAYRNASLIDGNAVGTYGLKFQVGIGIGPDYGIAVHPSDHFIQLSNSKLHWGNESPQARTGSQLVVWTQGDICYNLSAAVGSPKGWVCTVSGVSAIGGISAGANTLNVNVSTIQNGDSIRVVGAGVAGDDLVTTVASGGGTTTVVLTAAASTQVADAPVYTSGTWVSMGNL